MLESKLSPNVLTPCEVPRTSL